MRYVPYIPPYDRIPYGFCAADDEEYEMEENMEEEMESKTIPTDLIQLVQLPIITERLHTLKDEWERRAAEAKAMVCTEETIQAVKKFRADINKEYEQVETLRKAIKEAIMRPYNDFGEVYKQCVTIPKMEADTALASKIIELESAQKQRCEDGLREYFAELCAAHRIDWLTYEQANIRVDMASAKAKTPKKLREQLVQFVVRVAESVERISSMENSEEIMVEFQRTLDASNAIFTVQERHRRIEEQKDSNKAIEADKNAQEAVEKKVEESYQRYLQPPTEAVKTPDRADDDIIPRCTFTAVNATRSQLRKLKEFLKEEGIEYE